MSILDHSAFKSWANEIGALEQRAIEAEDLAERYMGLMQQAEHSAIQMAEDQFQVYT
jgi:hypothetical protein